MLLRLTFLLLIGTQIYPGESLLWIGLRNLYSQIATPSQMPKKLSSDVMLKLGVTTKQWRLLRQYNQLLGPLVDLGNSVIETCESSNRYERWNCSSLRQLPILPLELSTGSLEQAYSHSLSSALLAHSISKKCMESGYHQCRCIMGTSVSQKEFDWAGCNADTKFSKRLAQRFGDLKHKDWMKEKDRLDLGGWGFPDKFNYERFSEMNVHNNKVGRQIFSRSLATKCKCHGNSGSCAMKSCWKTLPSVDLLASDVMDLKLASISARRGGKSLSRPVRQASFELQFVAHQLNFCNPDRLLGTAGTQGRLCGIKGDDSNHCDKLCCGRGYTEVTATETKNCHCKFLWCCSVVCEKCRRQVTKLICE